MATLNKVLLIGNLTRDPEIRYTPKGTSVSDIGLAVNERGKDAAGNTTEETVFVDVTLWGKTAENVGQYMKKGSPLFVEGKLQLDSWEDKSTGQKRSKLKVVGVSCQFLPDGKNRGEPRNSGDGNDRQANPQPNRNPNGSLPEGHTWDDDDDIPF